MLQPLADVIKLLTKEGFIPSNVNTFFYLLAPFLAVTIALQHWDEFALHVRGAINNGLTPEEIRETIQHVAIYTGLPAANHAFRVAGPILEEIHGTA